MKLNKFVTSFFYHAELSRKPSNYLKEFNINAACVPEWSPLKTRLTPKPSLPDVSVAQLPAVSRMLVGKCFFFSGSVDKLNLLTDL